MIPIKQIINPIKPSVTGSFNPNLSERYPAKGAVIKMKIVEQKVQKPATDGENSNPSWRKIAQKTAFIKRNWTIKA